MTNWNPHTRQCKAKAKTTGKQCLNPCVRGYAVCRMHGANPKNKGGNPRIAELNIKQKAALKARMRGNKLGVKNGTWSRELLTDKEQEIYDWFRGKVLDQYPRYGQEAAPMVLLNELAFSVAKHHVATKVGSESGRSVYSGRISTLLKQLNIRPDVLKDDQRQDDTAHALMEALNRVRPLPDRQPKQLEAKEIIDITPDAEPEAVKQPVITNNKEQTQENEGT